MVFYKTEGYNDDGWIGEITPTLLHSKASGEGQVIESNGILKTACFSWSRMGDYLHAPPPLLQTFELATMALVSY